MTARAVYAFNGFILKGDFGLPPRDVSKI